jgi:hypothetical protein
LIARSVAQPEVFAVLFDRHASAVHRYLGRRVGELADDLLSETFLIAFRYGGDLRRLAVEADGDVDRAALLLHEVKGIGPTGAAVFLREAQGVWPWVRPYLDDRARAGARRVGLPEDSEGLAGLVPTDDLACFAAGLVRVSLTGRHEDPLGG